jgi:hypothetical protein
MQYFDSLPKIIQKDSAGVARIFTNLMARVSIKPGVLINPLVYYSYDIQEGDTPEIIAHKYYGDSYRYWVVLFANELLDPQWNWPMNGKVFSDYLTSKYGDLNITYSTIHHYEKILTQVDVNTNITTSNTVEIDENTYNNMFESTNTYTLPTGDVVVMVSKDAVSIYDYELKLNESKRNIKLLNSIYVDQLETEFKNLMSV